MTTVRPGVRRPESHGAAVRQTLARDTNKLSIYPVDEIAVVDRISHYAPVLQDAVCALRALLVAEHSRLFAENHFNRFARAWPVGEHGQFSHKLAGLLCLHGKANDQIAHLAKHKKY